MKTHDYSKYSEDYAKLGLSGTYYLAFRDIPFLLEEYDKNKSKILDYGCGTGRSLRFIRDLGYNDIVGVDINNDMIKEAKKIDPNGKYELIESAKIPYENNTFDIIFMSYVFLEVGKFEEIVKILKEFKRVLKQNGFIIFVTSIVTDIKDEWLSFTYDFEENNKKLNKCQNLKLLIKDGNIILHDYNWTKKEYEKAIKKSGLTLEKIHIPLGKDEDNYEWKSEKTKGYTHIFILSKNKYVLNMGEQ